MTRWTLAVVVLVAGLISCAKDETSVSPSCHTAWSTYASVVAKAGGPLKASPRGELGRDRFGPVDSAALDTLNRCSTAAEWWKAAQPYRSSALRPGSQRQILIDQWCAAFEQSDSPVCGGR